METVEGAEERLLTENNGGGIAMRSIEAQEDVC